MTIGVAAVRPPRAPSAALDRPPVGFTVPSGWELVYTIACALPAARECRKTRACTSSAGSIVSLPSSTPTTRDCRTRGRDDARPECSTFRVAKSPRAGTLRINLFIPAGRAGVLGFDSLGDGRGPSATAGPRRSRATFLIDYSKGRGVAFVNYSCDAGGGCESAHPLVLMTPKNADRALPRLFGGEHNLVSVNPRRDGGIALSYSLKNAAPGTQSAGGLLGLPISIPGFAVPRLDGTITATPAPNGTISGTFDRDAFPYVEIYQDRSGSAPKRLLRNQGSGDPTSLESVFPNETGHYPQ